MGQDNIVRYWHAVELLQPQSAPKLKKRSNVYSAFFHDTSIQRPVPPWTPESIVSRQTLPKQRVWSHTLYAHLYDSRLVAQKLNEVFGADHGYQEPQHRESALFAAKFNMSGHLVDNSLVLSSEAWFLGCVLTGKDWTRGFAEDQQAAGQQAATLFAGQVSGTALRELTQWILQFLGLAEFFGQAGHHRFRSQPIKPDKPPSEDDPLNSFLLEDLANVADNISKGVSSEALHRYLRQSHPEQRLHIDEAHASFTVIERLMPDAYANSCWPSEFHLGLVHSQQLAVNTILSTLGDGQGLLGVNGPPGTGKTTLLRDLIAAIITGRADALAKLARASDAFTRDGREQANDGGKQQNVYKLNPALYGFEIVVASSNNGAVENVTLELPQRDKIDQSWLPDAAHFAQLAELVSGKPAWGLISGALGSKARRKQFVDGYFYGQRPFGGEEKAEAGADEDAEIEPDANDDQDKSTQGFMHWLNAHAETNKRRSPEERLALWQQAVADYVAARAAASKACGNAVGMRVLVQSIHETRQQIAGHSNTLDALAERLADMLAELMHLDTKESPAANLALKQCLEALKQQQARKPGFWAKLFSLWSAQRDWSAKWALLQDERELAYAEVDRIARRVRHHESTSAQLEHEIAEARRVLQQLQAQDKAKTREASGLASDCRADHLITWLQSGAVGRGETIELAEPWQIEGWRQARARVFIQALKLHRTFIELEASRMRANLFTINNIVTGSRFQGISREATRSAWASLFMVVPVLSSTFASFARSFGSLQAGEIGWLLVDEAGQATPQAAVGALWRAQRALLVGDPLQLKPISTVSDAVLEHMRTRYRVDPHWLPNRQSAQTLADQATQWGRMAGPAGSKTWVGLPLAVHRRCDRPMYELANRIAYDGAMVYGTRAPSPEKETPASLASGWIDVRGPAEGNWVPAEGTALQELLALLREDGVKANDISVITPFRDVRDQLERLVDKEVVFGTIHTMQGKEAPVVIMVLGGNTAGSTARNWAVSEPNLLNVAATRAKRRFYVIGDKSDWGKRALFCDVMDLLPPRQICIVDQTQVNVGPSVSM